RRPAPRSGRARPETMKRTNPSEEAIKTAVRQRDGQKCTECGMTAEEHKRRFGRTLHVHRKKHKGPVSIGPYTVKGCVTICHLCHQAKHSIKCAVRKRDGYKCTECGLPEDERNTHAVHCDRGDKCDEDVWRQIGVKAKECVTLCGWCHFHKHSIDPVVLT